MPLYFFHLNFGHRVLPDEEGVELPNRSAAREEALAVVRDLADPKIGGNTRRWASWFLQVADDEGQFFRTPAGHPALEIVGLDAPELQTHEPKAQQRQPARAAPSLPEASRSADLVRELLARQPHAAPPWAADHHMAGLTAFFCSRFPARLASLWALWPLGSAPVSLSSLLTVDDGRADDPGEAVPTALEFFIAWPSTR
jgi:hypothetical protein